LVLVACNMCRVGEYKPKKNEKRVCFVFVFVFVFWVQVKHGNDFVCYSYSCDLTKTLPLSLLLYYLFIYHYDYHHIYDFNVVVITWCYQCRGFTQLTFLLRHFCFVGSYVENTPFWLVSQTNGVKQNMSSWDDNNLFQFN
jgi:hypothetical protein